MRRVSHTQPPATPTDCLDNTIENQLHAIRDMAFDEDRATVRANHAPQVMAACRNAASGLIHALGATAITATCRLFAAQPLAAALALGLRPDLE